MPRMMGYNPAAPAGTGTCTRVPVLSSQCMPTHLRHHSKHAHRRAKSLRCLTAQRPPHRIIGRPCSGHRITTALDESTTLAPLCNSHYNRTPDLGKCGMWRSTWDVTIRTYTTDFYLFRCTDTGVIVTHALYFYRPLAPLSCRLMRSSLL